MSEPIMEISIEEYRVAFLLEAKQHDRLADLLIGLVEKILGEEKRRALEDDGYDEQAAAIESAIAELRVRAERAEDERDDARRTSQFWKDNGAKIWDDEQAAKQRIADLEAEKRALMAAGKVLADGIQGEFGSNLATGEKDAIDVFTGQPGAIENWIGREGE